MFIQGDWLHKLTPIFYLIIDVFKFWFLKFSNIFKNLIFSKYSDFFVIFKEGPMMLYDSTFQMRNLFNYKLLNILSFLWKFLCRYLYVVGPFLEIINSNRLILITNIFKLPLPLYICSILTILDFFWF